MEVQGLAQLVARTPGGREVASSSLVSLTRNLCQGVAQLVARSVRDAEVVGSSPITLTIFVIQRWGGRGERGRSLSREN